MKGNSFWVAPLAVLAMVLPATSFAQSSEHARDVEAKIAYCKKCHQQNGQGIAAAYPVPRLAGQTVPYLEAKFGIIGEHKRDNPTAEQFMAPAIGSVDPAIRKEVATYFSMLQPPPAGGGESERISEGKKLYETGVAGKSCANCHGDDARGSDMTPRIAGQVYPYLLKVLAAWHEINKERDGVKAAAEHDLTTDQIVAVASYLSNRR
jgi:cytochrome c553